MTGLFITGTNTGVGKTHVGAMIAESLYRRGHRVGVYKPVESGCRRSGDQLIAADAQRLWEAAGKPAELSKVCPQRFEAAVAPPQAAMMEGSQVHPEQLREGLQFWKECSDIVLIEGAGGFMSPLSGTDYNATLAADLGLPLVIVSSNELGTINATLQTIITAQTVTPELPIAGVVLNHAQQRTDDESVASNVQQLQEHCDATLLEVIDFGQQELESELDWFELARRF